MGRDGSVDRELAEAMQRYLDCPCRYFESMPDDGSIMEAYREARARGQKEGFIPLLVPVDDVLWEWLAMNTAENYKTDGKYAFYPERAAAYRKEMLEAPVMDGREVLALSKERMQEMYEEEGFEWNETVEEADGGEGMNSFCGYRSYTTGGTSPLILAEIPVKNPWEIFAWVPFGGWNECPDTPELMAVAKYWYEQYGAVPAVVSHDVLEFDVPQPVGRDRAAELAMEQYMYCPDIVDQGGDDATVGMLADTLTKSTVWFFWWD